MGKLNILWEIPSDEGTYSGGSWVSGGGIELDNLKTQDITEIARTNDIAGASTQWAIDLGALKPVSGFAIINHNAPTVATYAIRLSETGSPDFVYEAEDLRFWEPTVVWGSRPWGAFPWDLVDPDDYPGTSIAYHLAPATVYARYIYVEATIPSGSYFDAGRFLGGQAFQPLLNMNAASVRPVDPSEVRRTRGGKRMVLSRPIYRQWRVTLSMQTEEEAMGVYFDLMYHRAKSGAMLLVFDPDKAAAIRARLTLYCALVDTTEISTTAQMAGRWGVTFDVEELI